jgi:hypothetical protein
MQRPLYRAEETQPVSKAPAPIPASTLVNPLPASAVAPAQRGGTAASDKSSRARRIVLMLLLLGVGYYLLYGSSTQRRRALIVLAVAVLLLLLGGISYYLYLPDLEQMARERRAVWQDPNLTWEEKRDRILEMNSSLTPTQARQVFQIEHKLMGRERNAEMYQFLKMSPEEQTAYLKNRDEERHQHGMQGMFPGGDGPRGGGGDGVVHMVRGGSGAGPGGGGPVIFGGGGASKAGGSGPGGGGPDGGPVNPGQLQKNLIDNLSPETRAGISYQRALSR